MTAKNSILHTFNGSSSPRTDYSKPENLRGSSWTPWVVPSNSSLLNYNEGFQDDESEPFTREDFFAELEVSAAELDKGLTKLEEAVPKEEMDEWLAGFNKSE